MKINHRIKRTTKQYIIVSLICIVIIGGASFGTGILVTNQIRAEYNALLTEANNNMKVNERDVYVAVCDISAGDVITDDKVKKTMVYSSQPQDSFISNKQIGQMTLIDIPMGTQIMATMLTDNIVSSELREVEYQVLNINANINSNDTIDIRIFFPNGESLVVLSKKVIKGIQEGSVMCYLWLDAEEITRMSAAIIDAALYPGTQLITTKYIEPSIQKASEITYTPSLAILERLETDPNILEKSSQKLNKEVRKALENRLAASMTANVAEINWDITPNLNNDNMEDNAEKQIKDNEQIETIDKKKDLDDVTEELGSNVTTEYFYYAEEQEAKDGEMEYGE